MPPPKPIAITMGEPAGIGGELTLKTWHRVRDQEIPFIALDNLERLRNISTQLKIDLPIVSVNGPLEAVDVFKDALPVYNIDVPRPTNLGKLDQYNSNAVVASIDKAISFAKTGLASAVVTNPIHKKNLYNAGYLHLGHTEYLADLSGENIEPVMMLACEKLRTVPITTHLSLSKAINQLSVEKIVSQSRIISTSLRQDFGIVTPRLAIAGLNPHAGEDGAMGTEEQDIISPAIEILVSNGIQIIGPIPPDTMFSEANRAKYDAAVCMYHDQAIIPVKTLDFSGAVNVTLGLPFVRTSPDHGTALDIAHKGIADETSMIAAFFMAINIARKRGILYDG